MFVGLFAGLLAFLLQFVFFGPSLITVNSTRSRFSVFRVCVCVFVFVLVGCFRVRSIMCTIAFLFSSFLHSYSFSFSCFESRVRIILFSFPFLVVGFILFAVVFRFRVAAAIAVDNRGHCHWYPHLPRT